MTVPLRVLVADDHQLLRQALCRALEEAGHQVAAEAADGEEALRAVGGSRPDVVLMDVSMPVLDGIEAARRIRSEYPGVPVVILTMHGEAQLRRDALEAGAAAFLSKDSAMDDVVATVAAVAAGDVDLSAELAGRILGELSPGADESPTQLTAREQEVLQLIADGCATPEVAARLFISAKTVKNHLASIYAKLDARDRTQAVLSAVRMGIVRLR